MRILIPSLAVISALFVTGCATQQRPQAVSAPQAPALGGALGGGYDGGAAYAGPRATRKSAPKPEAEVAPQPQQPLSAAEQRLAEMNAELVAAFDRIVARYGNPSTIRVFTNDPEKGRDFQKRMQLLQRVEQLRSEVALLEKRVLELNGDAEVRRTEIASLEERIKRHRVALAAFVRIADEAEQAFAQIGDDAVKQNTAKDDGKKQPHGGQVADASGTPAKSVSIDPTAYETK